MKIIPDDRQLYISARLHQEIDSKIRLAPFIYALHDGINLSKYGNGLQKFYFTFLILKSNNKRYLPGIYFNKAENSAEVAITIDYELAKNATKQELIRMMELAYLEGIDWIATLPLEAEFDTQAFKKDVAILFEKDNWFESAVEAA